MEAMGRQLDAEMEAARGRAEAAARQASASRAASGEEAQAQRGPGLRTWRREQRVERPGFRSHYTESYTVVGPAPPPLAGYASSRPPGPAAAGLGPLALLGAAAAAGFWASSTAAFSRAYHRTRFRERHRWALLAAWPLLAAVSPEFREQLVAALQDQGSVRLAEQEQQQQRSEAERREQVQRQVELPIAGSQRSE